MNIQDTSKAIVIIITDFVIVTRFVFVQLFGDNEGTAYRYTKCGYRNNSHEYCSAVIAAKLLDESTFGRVWYTYIYILLCFL